MSNIEAQELLQAFRLYAHDEFGENVSDYMIQKFIKQLSTEQREIVIHKAVIEDRRNDVDINYDFHEGRGEDNELL